MNIHDGGVEEENENYDIFTQSVLVFFPTSFLSPVCCSDIRLAFLLPYYALIS